MGKSYRIRPAKLAMAMIEAGMKNTEIAEEMRNVIW